MPIPEYGDHDLDERYCPGCGYLGEPQHDLGRGQVLYACAAPNVECDYEETWEVQREPEPERGQRATRPSRALVQRIPAGEIKAGKIPAALMRKSWGGSEKDLRAFAEVVGKVRRGDVSNAAQKAVLAESVKLLARSTHGAAWMSFFKKYGDDDLLAVEFAQGLSMAELLQASSLPRMTNKSGDRMIVFEFVRASKDTVGARFHVVDRGAYKGSIIKAVAPLKPFLDPKGGAQVDGMLRMVTAGIPQHAQDLLETVLSVKPSQIDPGAAVRLEVAMLSSDPAVIRGTGAWSRFPWPGGVDVRQPTGILNRLR